MTTTTRCRCGADLLGRPHTRPCIATAADLERAEQFPRSYGYQRRFRNPARATYTDIPAEELAYALRSIADALEQHAAEGRRMDPYGFRLEVTEDPDSRLVCLIRAEWRTTDQPEPNPT